MTKEKKAEIKEAQKNLANEHLQQTDKEKKDIEEIFKLAKQPIALTDKDFKMGEGEIDIRNLNDANKTQVMFRVLANTLTWIRNAHTDLVDVMRLLMLVCDKLGIDDITKANDQLETKIREQNKDKVA